MILYYFMNFNLKNSLYKSILRPLKFLGLTIILKLKNKGLESIHNFNKIKYLQRFFYEMFRIRNHRYVSS